jgi:hypothetical protein
MKSGLATGLYSTALAPFCTGAAALVRVVDRSSSAYSGVSVSFQLSRSRGSEKGSVNENVI